MKFWVLKHLLFLLAQLPPKDQLRIIAREELENARAAKRIYEKAPWLNHDMRLDLGAPDSVRMVDEKIRLLEGYLA